jgi:hypothetical protein
MTCYWDSIISSLTKEDYALIGLNHKPRREKFIEKLKEKNKLISSLWQGNKLNKKEQEEHKEAIECYNIKGIYNGHLTSICDSFLLLICDLMKLSIEHKFLNNNIKYSSLEPSRKTLYFKSNRGHFQRGR